MGLMAFLGAWSGLGGQVPIEGFFGCEPVSAKLAAFDQSVDQKVAEVTFRVSGVLRRLLDQDPLSHKHLGEQTESNALYHESSRQTIQKRGL